MYSNHAKQIQGHFLSKLNTHIVTHQIQANYGHCENPLLVIVDESGCPKAVERLANGFRPYGSWSGGNEKHDAFLHTPYLSLLWALKTRFQVWLSCALLVLSSPMVAMTNNKMERDRKKPPSEISLPQDRC